MRKNRALYTRTGIRLSLFLMVMHALFACRQHDKQINANTDSIVKQASVQSIIKIEPEGYYYPTESLIIGRYKLISILVIPQNNNSKFRSEITLEDSLSQSEMSIISRMTEVNSDSLTIVLQDNDMEIIYFRGKFLLNPFDNPKVIEKETIVLNGEITLNRQTIPTSLTYFAGD